jgi:hypothetical protein
MSAINTEPIRIRGVAKPPVFTGICCLCENGYTFTGNNPAPLSNNPDDRCCDTCNITVILARIKVAELARIKVAEQKAEISKAEAFTLASKAKDLEIKCLRDCLEKRKVKDAICDEMLDLLEKEEKVFDFLQSKLDVYEKGQPQIFFNLIQKIENYTTDRLKLAWKMVELGVDTKEEFHKQFTTDTDHVKDLKWTVVEKMTGISRDSY